MHNSFGDLELLHSGIQKNLKKNLFFLKLFSVLNACDCIMISINL